MGNSNSTTKNNFKFDDDLNHLLNSSFNSRKSFLNLKAETFRKYSEVAYSILYSHDKSAFSSQFDDSYALISALSFAFCTILKSPNCCNRLTALILNDIRNVSISDLQFWFSNSLYFTSIWNIVFENYFFDKIPSIPQVESSLLTIIDVYLINQSIPTELRSKQNSWDLAFSTKLHGKSWTLFQSKIQQVGSTIIIIREKSGKIFGGYASSSWTPKPKFYGTSDCFLYTQEPLKIYHSSNINSNYQYFNFGTKTLTNGLCFGGQVDYFALFIDESFEFGSCKGDLSSTFNNPLLSTCERFVIDFVEVWIVQGVIKNIVKEKSVLDDEITSNFLEMAGKKLYSKDLREPVLE